MPVFQPLKECEEPDEDSPNITGEINVNVVSGAVEYEYTVKIRSNLDHHTSLLKLSEKLMYESIHLAIFAEKKLKQ